MAILSDIPQEVAEAYHAKYMKPYEKKQFGPVRYGLIMLSGELNWLLYIGHIKKTTCKPRFMYWQPKEPVNMRKYRRPGTTKIEYQIIREDKE